MSQLMGSMADKQSHVPDIVTRSIGAFGKYHYWICFLVFISKVPMAWHQMAIIFLAPFSPYTCHGKRNKCPCSNPEFDTSFFTSTIIMKWNLICGRKWMATFSQIVFQFGTLIGSIIFGIASDRFGRRIPFIIAGAVQVFAGVTTAFTTSYETFTFLRFIVGLSIGGTMVVGFVELMEFVGTQYRGPVSAMYQIPFNIGHITLPLLSYLLRDYSSFELSISLPCVVMLLYICFLPETPRWLLARNRDEEAIILLERVAKINNLPTENIRANVLASQAELEGKKIKSATFLDLFRTPNIRKNILCMSFNWLTCTYCFFGVAQYISRFTGNIFINVATSATVVLIGTLLSTQLVKWVGRKTMLITSQAVCAICLFLLAAVPEGLISVIFASVGVVSAFSVFLVVHLYCSELFPTVIRNIALGFSSMSARIGSMIAPFVVDSRVFANWLPAVLFACLPTIAVIISFKLPETKDCELMTTLEEGEAFGKKNR